MALQIYKSISDSDHLCIVFFVSFSMSLEQQLADRLRDNYVRFTTDLCVDPELCSYFIQDRVFTENNKNDVMVR